MPIPRRLRNLQLSPQPRQLPLVHPLLLREYPLEPFNLTILFTHNRIVLYLKMLKLSLKIIVFQMNRRQLLELELKRMVLSCEFLEL